MKIRDVIVTPPTGSWAPLESAASPGVFDEAEIIDIDLVPRESSVTILMTGSLWFSRFDVLLVVARQVTACQVSMAAHTESAARIVLGSEWLWEAPGLGLLLPLAEPAGEILVRASRFEIYAGWTPGVDPGPPEYDQTRTEIRAGLPGWESEFDLHASAIIPEGAIPGRSSQ